MPARERTGFLTGVSSVGSTVGGAPVLPILVGLIGIVCAIKRKWRIAAFAVLVLWVESATYRIASLVVPRDRPHVARLKDLPADESYLSGYTAASLAVYCGLVLLLTSAIYGIIGVLAYGPFLLGIVAAGTIAFGAYSIADARYRRV